MPTTQLAPTPRPRAGRDAVALRGGPAAAAALCLAGAALVVVLGTRLSFFNDDWYFLFQRPGLESHGGLDTLLAPHNGNLVVLVAAAFKVIVAVFGIHSQLPFRLLVGACVAGLGAAVYMLARPRVGELLALLAVALVVFLGPAWEALLFITGANHTAALAFGLGALAALERDTPRRNLAACLLLVCAIAVANTGLALVAGAAIAIALRRRPRQAWIPGVPAALFVLWWALEGHRQSTGVTGGHVVRIPIYAVQALSSGLASLSGADHASLPSVLRSGHLQLAVLAVAVAVWLWRGGRPRPQALVFAGALVAFWVLAGASAIPGRGATASRYQITDVALMVVLAAELLHGVRPPRAVIGAVAVAALAMVASNLLVMRQGFRFLRQDAAYARADLGAIELAGPRAPATVWLVPPIGGDPYLSGITSSRYFAVTAAHGRPAFDSPAQLATVPAAQRASADAVLVVAYRLTPQPVAAAPPGASCRSVALGAPRLSRPQSLSTGRAWISNTGPAPLAIGLSRFGPVPHFVAFLGPHATKRLAVPADRAALPWRLVLLNPTRAPRASISLCAG